MKLIFSCLIYVQLVAVALSSSVIIRPPASTVKVGGLSSEDVLLIMLTEFRASEALAVQMKAFGHLFQTVVSTEKDHECTLCSSNETRFTDEFHDGGMSHFENMPNEWYCGQQRPLQALRDAINRTAGSLPRWIGIAEHDVYVNAPRLVGLLSQYPSDDGAGPIAIGDEWGGGAGFFFNRGAARRFAQPLKIAEYGWNGTAHVLDHRLSFVGACARQQVGGRWCRKHSDWGVAMCARKAGFELEAKREQMKQECDFNISTPEAAGADWERDLVSCHHVRSAAALQALHDHVQRVRGRR